MEKKLQRQDTGSKARLARAWWLSSSSMILLIVQGTLMSVVLRYSRVSSSSNATSSTSSSYLPSVSVAIAEVLKLAVCIVYLVICPSTFDSPAKLGESLPVLASSHSRHAMRERTKQQRWSTRDIFQDSVPMALPAAMFVMQQVLLIWSATYLDAVTYQIFTQAFKLVPTAVFSRLLLGQRLRPAQWLSIPTLALGVVCITANTNTSTNTSTSSGSTSSSTVPSDTSYYYYLAMAACSVAGLSSSFAGVYFELYVKGSMAGSLIKRNFQLGLYGVPFSVLYALVRDGHVIRERGLLDGFSSSAWGVVLLQVFGGFIIALVVKYCDNVLKNFALAGSVILTVLISIPLFGQWPSSFFIAGVSIVLLSVFMYSGGLEAMVNKRTAVVWALGAMFVVWDWYMDRAARRLHADLVAIRIPAEFHMNE